MNSILHAPRSGTNVANCGFGDCGRIPSRVQDVRVFEVAMKNFVKMTSLMLICGALVVGCGSSNNSANGTTCSNNGQNGTMVNGNCSVNSAAAASGTCPNPSYPYFISTVPAFGNTSGCCNTSNVSNGQAVCIPSTNSGSGSAQACIAAGGYIAENGQCL